MDYERRHIYLELNVPNKKNEKVSVKFVIDTYSSVGLHDYSAYYGRKLLGTVMFSHDIDIRTGVIDLGLGILRGNVDLIAKHLPVHIAEIEKELAEREQTKQFWFRMKASWAKFREEIYSKLRPQNTYALKAKKGRTNRPY